MSEVFDSWNYSYSEIEAVEKCNNEIMEDINQRFDFDNYTIISISNNITELEPYSNEDSGMQACNMLTTVYYTQK
jgi:hypothetical protein